jgi:monothiol glutaredoxin
MEAELKREIDDLLQENQVVLFMKGSKSFPQCGFSATVIGILKEAGVREIKDVNILARADLREGMKEYASWPTFPQLYVKGEFVGGCDIVKELYANGELFEVLGKEKPEVKLPSLRISDAAKQAITSAREDQAGELRIEITPQFEYALSIDDAKDGDLKVDVAGFTLLFDRQSAARADGMSIDFLDSGSGGFKIENPNEPARVRAISVKQLKQLLEQGALELFDVRTENEREKAKISGAQHFDQKAQEKLAQLDKQTPLYFHCHHGGRSQQAAEFYLRQGFKDVYNVAGGIDAWSQEVDPAIARY